MKLLPQLLFIESAQAVVAGAFEGGPYLDSAILCGVKSGEACLLGACEREKRFGASTWTCQWIACGSMAVRSS
eukprot:3187996-Amphidinium_carterae.2